MSACCALMRRYCCIMGVCGDVSGRGWLSCGVFKCVAFRDQQIIADMAMPYSDFATANKRQRGSTLMLHFCGLTNAEQKRACSAYLTLELPNEPIEVLCGGANARDV